MAKLIGDEQPTRKTVKSKWPKQWLWKRAPDAQIKDGLITARMRILADENVYCPAHYRTEILNSIQKVYNEDTAIEFAKQWGILYIDSKGYDSLRFSIIAISDYIFHSKNLSNQNNADIDYNEIADQVINEYIMRFNDLEIIEGVNEENVLGLRVEIADKTYIINIKGDNLEKFIDFADYVRRISEMKYLLNLFEDDPYIAQIETAEWVNKHYYTFYNETDRMLLPKINLKELRDDFPCQHYLTFKLAALRNEFSKKDNMSLYIELTPSGHPVLHFDSLRAFIEYNLLSEEDEPTLTPVRCADLKCEQLFFPSRFGQKYCPPLTNKKRSLCEQRHGQQLRREAKKKAH